VNVNDWREKHKQFSAALDADQVETQAMLAGLAHLEQGIVDEKMAGVVDDSLVETGNSWAERQSVLENLSGAVADEVDRRTKLMKGAYPFAIKAGTALEYRPSKTGVYEFCLAVARNPTGTLEGYPKASAIFEWIARDVLASYLGDDANGFRSGAPVYKSEGRGTGAKQTFAALQERCGEFCWSPEPNLPPDPSHQDLKDAGLDVVVWKPWPDGRLAQLFALGQCACGKNDITANKGRELSLIRLGSWLRPVCHAPPIRCFLAAHHIPNTIELYNLSKETGLVFDRARIVLLAELSANRVKSPEGINYHQLAQMYVSTQVGRPTPERPQQKEVVAPRSRRRGTAPPPSSRKTHGGPGSPEGQRTPNN
jgi:hypothetical protein